MQINKKIEYWKNRLLDLGKRNRLINSYFPKSGTRISRTAILIYNPSLQSLWDTIVEKESTIKFLVPIDLEDEFEDSDVDTKNISLNGMKTNQTPRETYKTVRSIASKAKVFTDEKGFNALYLAFGFLKWKENGLEGIEMRSPLLLVPVILSQDSINDPIVLSRSDDEITINHALEQKLLNDFGIKLPRFEENENCFSYLLEVERLCKKLNWTVDKKYSQLSLFSFLKINMYRDIEKYHDQIISHPIIRTINGESYLSSIDSSNITNYNHDSTEPLEVYSVVDADSSQQDAILLAKRGVSFVLQGPPGTGKSQTITNIIAELIADGKKVLFVSEKKAALEVVYKRLQQVDLGNYCLSLHNHNSKRREILDQLEVSSKLAQNKAKIHEDAYSKLLQLKEVRASLNDYNIQLHTIVQPLGKTIFEINGYVAKYNRFKNVDYIQSNADSFTPELLAECGSALGELTRIVRKSNYQNDNPWNGCKVTNVTHEFRQQFMVDSLKLMNLIREGTAIHDEFIILTSAYDIQPSWFVTPELIKLIEVFLTSPKISGNWLKLDINDVLEKTMVCMNTLGEIEETKEFVRNLKKYTEYLTIAIEGLGEISKIENVEIANEEYNAASERFVKLLPDGDVSITISNYYKNAISNQSLIGDLEKLESAFEQVSIELIESQRLVDFENESYIAKHSEWTRRRENLLIEFDEKIMLADIESIILRYRTTYRSLSKRILNKEYRIDKNSILIHYKKNNKMRYIEILEYLDMIINVINWGKDTDEQFETLTKAKESRERSKIRLKEIESRIISTKGKKDNNTVKFNKLKEKLITQINECLNSYEIKLQQKESKFLKYSKSVSNKLKINISKEIKFDDLVDLLGKTIKIQFEMQKYSFSDEFKENICNRDVDFLQKIENYKDSFVAWINTTSLWLNKFTALFDDDKAKSYCEMKLEDLYGSVHNCSEKFAYLEYLIDYQNSEKHLKKLGIDEYLELAKNIQLDSTEIIPVFNKCFYRSWLDLVMPNFPAVNMFRRERQDARILQFKYLDKSHLAISRAALQAKLLSRLPNLDSFSVNSGEVAILRRELAKQRKLLPIRKLISAIPNLLPTLKPCMMMSPLSVSTYFGDSDYKFDTVLFDEASQIRTEDAICSIFRAKQVIIAGDSMQLPPTDFFSSSISDSDELEDENGDFNDNGAYESLLDESVMLPSQTLLWHYRSKHEQLISFSNSKIYKNNLITFPSSIAKAEGMGVEYVYVQGGIYERKGKSANKNEAQRITDLVFEHFQNYPTRTIGIIAFGEAQQTVIEEYIMRRRRENPRFEHFFKEDNDEPLFIKNLETVQGDERDTIIFSIGYAPDSAGKFLMNFGPLSRSGGERRLNVAITRARYNLKLVGSILPTDIDVERISGLGPKLLRLYIDFAINGESVLQKETSITGNIQFDSPFEESVFEFLEENNYNVQTQVGCSGYRIDMAIKHPKYNGRYSIGIECDGASYHSARTARERDRLRQTVLEDMGWKIYRIWSTDWIKDRHTEGQRLLKVVEDSINDYRESISPSNSTKNKSYITISHKTEIESVQEKYKLIKSRYAGNKAEDIPIYDFERTMERVLKNDFGLSKDDLFKETARFGYLWSRQGNRIRESFERLIVI